MLRAFADSTATSGDEKLSVRCNDDDVDRGEKAQLI